jgi:hypothetical protein
MTDPTLRFALASARPLLTAASRSVASTRQRIIRASSSHAVSSVATDSARPHLLWIDDHPDLMAPLTTYLTKAGFDLEFALTGEAGVRLALTGHHSTILVDLRTC